MNSADFQKGGFDLNDAKAVIQLLNELGLVELSGGSYESPAMQGRVAEKDAEKPKTTLRREAYFVDFAREIASVAKMPIMVTGGILRRAVAEEALEKDSAGFGVEMLGLAQAMAFQPDLPNQWRDHELEIKLPQGGLEKQNPRRISKHGNHQGSAHQNGHWQVTATQYAPFICTD